jgi:hypothetical protein
MYQCCLRAGRRSIRCSGSHFWFVPIARADGWYVSMLVACREEEHKMQRLELEKRKEEALRKIEQATLEARQLQEQHEERVRRTMSSW